MDRLFILALLSIGIIISIRNVAAGLIYEDSRPGYLDCIASAECGKSECCAINPGRYSIAMCRPRPDLGEPCRPDNPPFSLNVTYPDEVTVSLNDIYSIICPCQRWLTCSKTGECIDPSEDPHFNYVLD